MALPLLKYQELLRNLPDGKVVGLAKAGGPKGWMPADELRRREEMRSAEMAEMSEEQRGPRNVLEEYVARASGVQQPAGGFPQGRGNPADVLASKGRGGDSQLMHVGPDQVNQMATSINRETGLPEAFWPAALALPAGGFLLKKLVQRYGPAAAKYLYQKLAPGAAQKAGTKAFSRTARAMSGQPTRGDLQRTALSQFSKSKSGKGLGKAARSAGNIGYYGGLGSLGMMAGSAMDDEGLDMPPQKSAAVDMPPQKAAAVDADINELISGQNDELFGVANPENFAAANRPPGRRSGVDEDRFREARERWGEIAKYIVDAAPNPWQEIFEPMAAFGAKLGSTPGDFGPAYSAAMGDAANVTKDLRRERRDVAGERVALVGAETNLDLSLEELALNFILGQGLNRARGARGGAGGGVPTFSNFIQFMKSMIETRGVQGIMKDGNLDPVRMQEAWEGAMGAYHLMAGRQPAMPRIDSAMNISGRTDLGGI